MSSSLGRPVGLLLLCASLTLAVPAVASAADATPPVSTMTASQQPNALGWWAGNQRFTVNATDEPGGSGVEKLIYEVDHPGGRNALAPTTFLGTREMVDVLFEGWYTFKWHAVDFAGNHEAQQSAFRKVDSSGPDVTEPVTTGHHGGNGWWRSGVTVSITATDPPLSDGNPSSGIAWVTPPQTLTTTGVHELRMMASDNVGHERGWIPTVRVDADAPQVSVTGCPAEPVTPGTPVSLSVDATDVGSGLMDDPTGTYTLDTSAAGTYERTFTTKDWVQYTAEASCSYEVLAPLPGPELYDFSGFFRPVSMTDLNAVKAGRSVPVLFSLGGDQGLDVIAADYPRSVQVPCSSIDDADAVEPTSTPGESGLTYDAATDQYHYVWKTDSAWAGQCRQFVLKLDDDTTHRAYFRFR